MGTPQADGNAPGNAGAPAGNDLTEGHNRWDFLIVLIVVLALVALTIFLAVFFRKTPSTIATILGIVVPAFAAVFGASLGNAAGKVTGRQQGQQQGRQQVKATLLPKVNDIQGRAGGLVQSVRTHADNPPGSSMWRLSANFAGDPVNLMSAADMDQLASDIDSVRGYLENL
ncbi:MAG TPA: hypothetical protein VIX86_14490 [Streptosporangiaceae bacterium]